MNRRRRALVFILATVASLIATQALAATETPFIQLPGWQTQPTGGSSGYIVIASDDQKPGHFDTLATSGGPVFKVNKPKTESFSGGVAGGNLLFQETRGNSSDLFFYDLPTRNRSNPPAGMNTKFWEWGPTISDNWALFARNNFNTSAKKKWQKIILFDLGSGASRLLAKTGRTPYLAAGQVNGNYAVWERCTNTCDIFVHDIGVSMTSMVPNPTGLQYSPSLAPNGTIFFARRNNGTNCGQGTTLVRRTSGGVETVFHAFPNQRDVYDSFAVTSPLIQTDLFYSRYNCKKDNTDIYYISGAETAAPAAVATRQGRPAENPSGAWVRPIPPGSTPGA
ncbi:MAG: hypothetical protein WD004_08775 [Actinomycetota bacterium]